MNDFDNQNENGTQDLPPQQPLQPLQPLQPTQHSGYQQPNYQQNQPNFQQQQPNFQQNNQQPPYFQGQYQPPMMQPPMPPRDPKKGFAIASMILGIVSIVGFCMFPFTAITSILAIIFGAISRKSSAKGMAIAGIITGVIGIIIFIGVIVSFVALGTTDSNGFNYNYKF